MQGDGLYKALLEALIHNNEYFIDMFAARITKKTFNTDSLYVLYSNVSYS